MEGLLADVFNSDVFSMTTLTASINEQPYIPDTISKSGIFTEEGIPTTTLVIEKKGQTLELISSRPRGAPPQPNTNDKRKAVSFIAPHLITNDRITADEVAGVRAFGSNNALQTIEDKRDEKLLKMSTNLDVTNEYHRLGAIQGLVLDADGSVLYNLFEDFDIEQPATVPFYLLASFNTTSSPNVIRPWTNYIRRQIRAAIGGPGPRAYWALCGDQFFDTLTSHPEVRATYMNQQQANDYRGADPLESFNYAGVTWENYRGWGEVAIPENACQFVPMGVSELFITRFAPADYFSAVNTKGLPKYVLPTLDQSGQKWIDLEAQSNPVNICTRPQALFTASLAGTSSSSWPALPSTEADEDQGA